MNLSQFKFSSPLGTFYLVASDTGLRGLYWEKQDLPLVERPKGILQLAVKELTEYFTGTRKKFDIPLEVEGTEFQKKVWNELRKIPYGQTISYQELAKRIKNMKACRAVGTANGRNPISIIVPCHRVIAANGTLGGYAGGLKMKTKLLELEGIQLQEG